ncbi:uncharacterized protein RCO7_08225 [Rhynchosporium graminicola]|uniref:Uncharacterized protein n=1 Tax=Rhynchosporium graminicola TaxID=2792576 RepID=A0A1E1LDA1_9HELO|nr:uncharacterized protein RCO7_08225 [Rhynchosporium commune]
MRYQNWDVLLFADQFKVPLQEFKTSCQVIQDPELHNMQLNPLLLPTVTSFIPGLPAGSPFRVSIHCWQNPDVSRYGQTLKKPSDVVMFEARLFIDGRLTGGPWPTIIDLSVDLDKHGEFEKMKFPAFHRELLSQSYWNPGDDLGRIKVVISEGFSREQPNYAFERIKNIVSFSFQHAPLDVLESSSIAWPNAAMWRQVALVGPYLAQHFSPHPGSDEFDAHSHSPRHGQSLKSSWPISGIGSMPPPSLLPRQPNFDPFVTDHSNNPAFSDWRHASSTDTSMPDYSSTNTRSNTSRHVSDHMQVVQAEKTGRQFESIQTPGAYETLCEALMPPAAPANTPDNGLVSNMASLSAASRRASSKMSIDGPVKAEEPTLPKPFGFLKSSGSNNNNIKSRKENIQDSPLVTVNINPAGNENATRKVSIPYTNAINLLSGAESNTASREEPIRKTSQSSTSPARQAVNSGIAAVNNENPPRRVSQPFTTTNNSGTKRQRVVTPAAAKVIDEEDEPRSSPSLRKASQASARTDGRENERVVLGGIENV